MSPFRQARIVKASAQGIELALEAGWRCRVGLVAPGVGRLLMLPPDGLREPRSWSVLDGADPWQGADRLALFAGAAPARLVQDSDALTLDDGRLRLRIGLSPFTLAWDQSGDGGQHWQPCCADRASFAYAHAQKSGTLGHWQARDACDQYFGLGDKTGPLNKAGRRLRTRQLDALGYNGESSDPLYKHWPFFIGRRADSGLCYGVYYDTQAECCFDFGQEFDNYHGFYRHTEIADGDLDAYVFAGPDMAGVLARFLPLIGGTAMPPRWSLGYANTAMALADAADGQAQIAGFLARARACKFPLSAFHFGSGYTSRGKRRYVFTWNRDKFPEPQALLGAFRAAGVRTVANLKPCLLDDHPAFAAVAAQGGFVAQADGAPCLDPFWDGWGAHLDFGSAAGRQWWQSQFQAQVLTPGFDAGWNDNNEYPIWNEAGQSQGQGQPLAIHRCRPVQALWMTQATALQQQAHRPAERVYTVTRAGPPGIQRLAQTWTGDNTTSWHTLRWNQRMAMTMSLSGMFNTGHDIGGFAGPEPGAELLIRWAQACCLNPRMMMNSWKADGQVNSPWLYPEALPAIHATVRLRLRLLPYLYTLLWQARQRHLPVLRPSFFDFGDDPRCWADDDPAVADSMMVGPELLLAPVFEAGARQRRVYLPLGAHASGWFDLGGLNHWPGGSEVTVDAALEQVPIFVRAGALLPMTDSHGDGLLTEEPSRLLRYFPAPAGSGRSQAELFEDDGLQTAFDRAGQVVHQFSAVADDAGLAIQAAQLGDWPLPYDRIGVELPAAERRPLSLRSGRVPLVRA